MGFGFDLVEHATGLCGTVYSFRKDGEEDTEIEKFWSKPDVRNAPDYDPLYTRLYDTEEGLLHVDWWERSFNLRGSQQPSRNPESWAWLKDEGDDTGDPDHPRYNLEALWAPIPVEEQEHLTEPYPSLRLYLFQIPDVDPNSSWAYNPIFVVGNGDVKDVDRIHEKQELKSAVDDIRYVLNRVYERIEWQNDLKIVDDGFRLDDGNDLRFDLNTQRPPL
jgi:hypothetical protein